MSETTERPWSRLLDYAELMSRLGHHAEAATAAWKVRAMIYEHSGVKDAAKPLQIEKSA